MKRLGPPHIEILTCLARRHSRSVASANRFTSGSADPGTGAELSQTSCRPLRDHASWKHLAATTALVLVGAVGLAACSSTSSTTGSAVRSTAPASASASAASSGASSTNTPAASIHIVIKNFAFHPDNFTVAPGATITVTNEDSVDHTFTARNKAFNTGDIAPGQTVHLSAPSTPGTYPYLCLIHQFMTGVMTVK